VFAVRFSPQATRLASCSLDGTVAVLDTEADDDDDSSDNGDDNQAADTKTGACYKQLATLASHRAPILDLAWQSETVFASCSTDKTVQISRLGSERPPKVLTGHASEVNCLCWDASRAVLASGSDDSTVKLWSTRDGQLASYAGHTGPVHRLCWGPSAGAGAGSGPFAPLIVSSGADGTSRVWDVNTGACRYTLEGHSAAVASARMSPDGAMLATASLDRRVLVWSLAEGRLLHTFENASAGALDVAWHVGGQTLAAAYTDGTAAVLQLRKQGVSEV
jgi:transducin (beta)-like 1